MKVEIKKLPNSEIELNIIVPAEHWHEFLDETAKELSKDLKTEGFRPGFAPMSLVEQKVGMSHILEHAAEHCVHKCYVNAILNNNIEAIGKPEISVTKIAKDNPFEFRAKVAVMPEVKLPDYKKIAHDLQKDKKEVSVSDEEISKSIDWLQKSRAKYITVSRPAQAGDRVEIDFEGYCENNKMDKLCSKNHPAVLGRGYFLPGFEENLFGMKEGGEKEFSIKFPDDFEHQHLAGKDVNFKAKMNLVQEAELSEINDEFARGLGNFDNLETLRQSIKKGILMEKQNQEKDRWRANLVAKIAEKSEMEIPRILLEAEERRMEDDLRAKVAQIDITYEQYLEKFKKTENDIKKEFGKNAIERVKAFSVLNAIAKKENIEVSEQEILDEANKALRHFEQIKQAEQNIDTEQLKNYTKDILKNEKVFQLLEKSE